MLRPFIAFTQACTKDLASMYIDRLMVALAAFIKEARADHFVQSTFQLFQCVETMTRLRPCCLLRLWQARLVEGFCIKKISINETRKEHPCKKLQLIDIRRLQAGWHMTQCN